VPVVILSDLVFEKQIDRALEALEALPEISGKITRIRVEELDGGESR
jgi:hypothetical protein